MPKILICLILICLPIAALAQEQPSKKELRQRKKEEKLEKQHQKLVAAVKDTIWVFSPSKSNMTPSSKDWSIFTLYKNTLTLEEVFIPNAKNTKADKRIATYIAPIKAYSYSIDESKSSVQISLVFVHERTNYSMYLKKNKGQNAAVVEIKSLNNLLVVNEGKIRG